VCLQHNGSFVSVTESADVAKDLLNNSPMTYDYLPDTSELNMTWSPTEITAPINPIRSSSGTGGDAGEDRHVAMPPRKTFNLHVFPADNYSHSTRIAQSPLHGPWPSSSRRFGESFAYRTLKRVVPKGPDHDALCDWETGSQLQDSSRERRAASHVAFIEERSARREKKGHPMLEIFKQAKLNNLQGHQQLQGGAADEAAQPIVGWLKRTDGVSDKPQVNEEDSYGSAAEAGPGMPRDGDGPTLKEKDGGDWWQP
jgi:hypothetical protein